MKVRNMKKKVLLIIVFIMFIIPNTVLAYREPCTTKNLNSLKNKAYNVNLSYELKKDESDRYYFEVNVTGLHPDIEVRYGSMSILYNENQTQQTVTTNTGGNVKYTVDIYAASGTACDGTKLTTKSIALPKYNVYSERDECIEYEEFSLCNKWYKGKIESDLYFSEELDKYIKSLKKPEPVDPSEKIGPYDKVIDFIQDHLFLFIFIVAVIVIGIIYLIARAIIRKKNRVKIDI
jgi:hypothetical protein